MRCFFSAIICAVISVAAFAEIDNSYDFEYEGIRYRILSEEQRTVETVSKDEDPLNNGDNSYDLPSDAFTIPEKVMDCDIEYTVVKIGEYSFSHTKTRKFGIPSTIKELGHHAFYLSELEEIEGGDGIRIFSGNAFDQCNIRELSFSDSVETIGRYLFTRCDKLRRIEYPKSIETITYLDNTSLRNINPIEIRCQSANPPQCYGYKGEFWGMEGDKRPKNTWLVVPSQSIEKYQKDVTWSIFDGKIIPDDYTLNSALLFECNGLFFSEIADSNNLVAIVRPPKQFMEHPYGYGVGGSFNVPSKVNFQGKEYTVHTVGGFMDSEYDEIILPPTVKAIDRLAFIHSKVKRINLDHITEIRHQAFQGSQLENVKLPENIKLSIDGVFFDCLNLVMADMPARISLFGDGNIDDLNGRLFTGCLNLCDLFCRSKKPFKLTSENGYDLMFSKVVYPNPVNGYISPTVWVPKGAVDAYCEAWGKYTDDFREMEEEPVSITEVATHKAVAVTVADGTAQISGIEGSAVTITSVSGLTVYRTANAQAQICLPFPRGIYLLTVNGKVMKFSV